VPCKSTAEIDAFFEPKQFAFAFVNSYFDFTDYDKPVHAYLDDSVSFGLEADREKRANIFVMKAEIDLNDDQWVQLTDGPEDDFSLVSNVQLYDDKIEGDAIVNVAIRYD
jgi:hypothetical protein